jgi:hypothetical protein
VSFLLDAVHAAEGGIYELKEFLRSRCRAADADITISVGEPTQEIAVRFVEGMAPMSDEDLWALLADMSATSVEINRDGSEVAIVVEFD